MSAGTYVLLTIGILGAYALYLIFKEKHKMQH
ncbi:hypothetical protein SAMN05660197_1322 [Nitratiruptor tergarcus DSM 16512]|uniref:Uncharacterized protein n=1 Tax=Nitratiruptor tergarcus DSM 16512 TaxID=1069081 RepID=A0A1W1WTJ3_9BACT|nr:hypothetical protein SAMN05660197_1322 [Nitratiruptor tergarcus DSM 16512]